MSVYYSSLKNRGHWDEEDVPHCFDSKMLQDKMLWIGQLCLLQDLSTLEGGSDRIMFVEMFRNK